MDERKLAHIEMITALSPIEGADRIEVATVLGWQCVVKKGEFKVGQRIVYIEVDSVMPDKPEYEFLRDRKFRIKTIKLKGQISQGLIIPLPKEWNKNKLEEGDDVTSALGIEKYLTPSERNEEEEQAKKIANERNKLKKFMMRYSWFRRIFLSKKQKNGFPFWVSKTDEERIQNMPKVLEQYADSYVYVTEKIDYQSSTFTGKLVSKYSGILGKIFPKKFKFVVCSRNIVNNDKNSLYWQIANKYKLEKILRENPSLTIQGEQGSTSVQGNKYKIKEPTLWVFNIIDHERNYHYNYFEMKDFCDRYGLQVVPILYHKLESESIIVNRVHCTLSELGSTVQDLVEYSKGKSVLADIPREGVVVRCIEDGKKVFSFKVINPNFLLKYD